MKLNIVIAAVYALAIETAVVAAGGECYPSGYIELSDQQKNDLRGCLDSYDPWTWDSMRCGAKGWFRGHDIGWASSNECKDLCYDCIKNAINDGHSGATCWWTSSPSVRCWTGYE